MEIPPTLALEISLPASDPPVVEPPAVQVIEASPAVEAQVPAPVVCLPVVEPSMIETQAAPAIEGARHTAKAGSDAYKMLVEAMNASPAVSPKPKAEFRALAKTQFGTGTRAFNREWDRAIEATGAQWSKSGRRPNQNA